MQAKLSRTVDCELSKVKKLKAKLLKEKRELAIKRILEKGNKYDAISRI
jgi:hypothetical protein